MKMKYYLYFAFSLSMLFVHGNTYGSDGELREKAFKKNTESKVVIKRISVLTNEKSYKEAKKLVRTLEKNLVFFNNLYHGKYGSGWATEEEDSYGPSDEEFYIAISEPYVASSDFEGYLASEAKIINLRGRSYWEGFAADYGLDGAGEHMTHIYKSMELKRNVTCLAQQSSKLATSEKFIGFWKSSNFTQDLLEYGIAAPSKADKDINVSSWFTCNKSNFLGDSDASLASCAQYAHFSNYYDPLRYRNRDYALALYFSGKLSEANKQLNLYRMASGDKTTIEQLADPACYPAARKLKKLPEIMACSARNYDSEHLAKHPLQQVTDIRLSTLKAGAMRLGVKLRQHPNWLEENVSCSKQGINQQCKLACDGGSFTMAKKGDRLILTNKGIKLPACTPGAHHVDPAQDQGSFLLEESSPSRCYAR